MKRIIFLIILILGVIFVAGCSSAERADVGKVVVFKSSTCGCCALYANELKKQGFDVKTVDTIFMSSVKEKYNIPQNMASCHTTTIGDYFIEGHVPIQAIDKLLEEKPDIDGIALPGMPSGSPGMPGVKTGSFRIYAISDGVSSEFMII